MKLNKLLVLASGSVFALGAGIAVLGGTAAAQLKATSTVVATTDLDTKAEMEKVYTKNQLYGAGDVKWVIRGGHNNYGTSAWSYMRFGCKAATVGGIKDCWISNHDILDGEADTVVVSIETNGKNYASTNYICEWGVEVYSSATSTSSEPYIAFSETDLIDKVAYSGTSYTDFSSAISEGTLTFKAGEGTNSTLTSWPADAYYKVYWTVADGCANNGIINVSSITWSKTDGGDPEPEPEPTTVHNTTIDTTTVTGLGTTYATSELTWTQSEVSFTGKGIRKTGTGNALLGFNASSSNYGYLMNSTALGFTLHGIAFDSYDKDGNPAAPSNVKLSVGWDQYSLTELMSWDADRVATLGSSFEGITYSIEGNRVSINLEEWAITYVKIERTGGNAFNVKRFILEHDTTFNKGLATANATTSGYCGDGMSSSEWGKFKALFESLNDEEQAIVKNADTSSPLTEVERLVARYDYCVAKYGYEDFAARGIGGGGSAFGFNAISDNNSNMLITLACLGAGMVGIGAMLALRRKKEN